MATETDNLNVNVNFNVNGDTRAQAALRGISSSASGIRAPAAGATAGLTSMVGAINPARAAAAAAAVAITGVGSALLLAKNAVEQYIASNETARAGVDAARGSFTNMLVTLGEAITSNGVLKDATAAVGTIMDSLSSIIRDNSDTFSGLARDGIFAALTAFEGLVIAFNTGYQIFEIMRITFTGLKIAALAAGTGIVQLGIAISGGVLEVVQQLVNGVKSATDAMATLAEASGADGLAETLRQSSASMQNFSTDIEGTQAALTQLSDDLSGMLTEAYGEAVNSSAEYMANMANINTLTNELRQSLDNTRSNLENNTLAWNSNTTALNNNATAQRGGAAASTSSTETIEAETTAVEKQILALKELSTTQLGLGDLKAQSEKAAAAGMLESIGGEKGFDQIKLLGPKLTEMFGEFKQIGIEGGLSLADAFGTALGSGDFTQFKKNSGKIIGSMISDLGRAMIAAGIGISIADPVAGFMPNPVRGGALIGAGTAAVVLGAALGAASGGGGGSKGGGTKSVAAGPSTSPGTTQQTVVNQVVQFGFVGDRRAAARDVAIETDRAARLGYR